MIIKTDFDVGQKVYRVVIDPKTLCSKTPIYVAHEFIIDRIAITKKLGATYHCKGDGNHWHGWVFGSKEIFTDQTKANHVAQALNEQIYGR